MFPMNRKVLNEPVTVEYDSRGQRVRKVLPNAITARRFYAAKLKAGHNPAVVYRQAPKG